MRNLIKLFTLAVGIGAVLLPVYALAASRPNGEVVGEGAVAISGWTVSNVDYQLSSDPSLVKKVSFDLDAPAGRVAVKLQAQGTAYTSCINLYAYHWQCDFPAGVSVRSLDEFRVIAVGN